MSLKLYTVLGSPPARSTILTVRALALADKIQMVPVDVAFAKEHLNPEYIAKNPCHTVPMLEDGNFVLWDSHAINSYLVGKYGTDDSLYPKDLQKRSLVDCMAHFDTGYLFGRAARIIKAIMTQDKSANFEKMKTDLAEVYDMLELILSKPDRDYVAGQQLTIADFSIVTSVSTAALFAPIDAEKYSKITSWHCKMKKLPYYYINEKGNNLLKEVCNKFGAKL